MIILSTFLGSLFGSILAGAIISTTLAIYYFINNKRSYGIYTWNSFRIPSYMILASIVAGFTFIWSMLSM